MNIGGFIIAAVLLTLLPGPDILLVITQSVMRGAKTGIIFAAGLCTGIIFHTAIVAFGLSPLITGTPGLFTAVKIAGALYLIYLGIRAFLSRRTATLEISGETSGTPAVAPGKFQYYKRGVIMNVLNPKVILFFLALFPQFITVQPGESSALKFMILGIIFMLQGFAIFSTVAFCAGKLSSRLIGNKKIAYYLCLTESSIFTLLGIAILF